MPCICDLFRYYKQCVLLILEIAQALHRRSNLLLISNINVVRRVGVWASLAHHRHSIQAVKSRKRNSYQYFSRLINQYVDKKESGFKYFEM